MNYTEKKFDIPALDGISAKSIEEHLELYAGYVKNFNAISEKMVELSREDMTKNILPLNELIRRRSFEFDGMRLHEYYFSQFEGGSTPLATGSPLEQQFAKEYHKTEYLVEFIKAIASLRGPGWAVLYWDPEAKQFVTSFVGEQHQGHLVGLPVVLALDVWEHAFLLDYGAQGKGKYIDAFFKNLNWKVVADRFEALTK